MHRLAEFLSRRYPEVYSVVRHDCRPVGNREEFGDWGWDGLPPIQSVKIKGLGVEYELPLRASGDEGKRAMKIAGLL